MPNNLQADVEVTITPTLPENSFVGTPVTAPALVPVTLIQREADIQPQRFIFRPVDLDVYTLSIHGFQVIELEGRVFSFVDQRPEEWVVTYRENYDAYTITKRLYGPEEIGWIAPIGEENPQAFDSPRSQALATYLYPIPWRIITHSSVGASGSQGLVDNQVGQNYLEAAPSERSIAGRRGGKSMILGNIDFCVG
ncbi:hypothetical protein EDD15DRAFT_2516444 [Pisolithus albus]|nr:hypothetical protein EDD15DRAFT_2516444 [Pisolithus albus]